MILCGADPGFDGALCFLDVEGMRVVGIVDVPTAKKKSGRRELLLHELVSDCLGVLDGRRCGHLYLEKVNAFAPGGRRMGASSAFSLGECSMAIRMLAACHGWPVTMIGPAQWKRAFSLGADKSQARLRASELLPEDAQWWTPKRGRATIQQANGRAEAALLALYGARSMQSIATERSPMVNRSAEEADMSKPTTTNSAIGPVASNTYHGIAQEQLALEREIAMRKPGLDVPPLLQPGEVPFTGGVWDGIDNRQPTLDETDDC